eukprot:2347520-Rhodomonas_salina.1
MMYDANRHRVVSSSPPPPPSHPFSPLPPSAPQRQRGFSTAGSWSAGSPILYVSTRHHIASLSRSLALFLSVTACAYIWLCARLCM